MFVAYYYFQFAYTEQTFSQNILSVLKNRIDIRWFYVYIFKLLADSPLILPLVIALVVAIKSIAVNNNPSLYRISMIFILQLFISTGLSIKWGSSLGYFNESYFIGFIALGLSLSNYSSNTNNGQIISSFSKYLYPALLIFFTHVSLQIYFYFLNNFEKEKNNFKEQVMVSNYIKTQIGDDKKYVLDLTNPDLDFFKNLLYKESIAPTFDIIDCCTLPDKTFNYQEMLASLQNGKTFFLIGKKGSLENSIWNIPLTHYKADTTIFNYTIFKFSKSEINNK